MHMWKYNGSWLVCLQLSRPGILQMAMLHLTIQSKQIYWKATRKKLFWWVWKQRIIIFRGQGYILRKKEGLRDFWGILEEMGFFCCLLGLWYVGQSCCNYCRILLLSAVIDSVKFRHNDIDGFNEFFNCISDRKTTLYIMWWIRGGGEEL